MTIITDNGQKVTRFYKILLEDTNGNKETVIHTNPTFQHLPKGTKQTCIGFFDRPQQNEE